MGQPSQLGVRRPPWVEALGLNPGSPVGGRRRLCCGKASCSFQNQPDQPRRAALSDPLGAVSVWAFEESRAHNASGQPLRGAVYGLGSIAREVQGEKIIYFLSYGTHIYGFAKLKIIITHSALHSPVLCDRERKCPMQPRKNKVLLCWQCWAFPVPGTPCLAAV